MKELSLLENRKKTQELKVVVAEGSGGAQKKKNQSIAELSTTLKATQWGINLAKNTVRHIWQQW